MGSMGIDGLITGLQSSTIIAKLMKYEQAPRNSLIKKSAGISAEVKALQALNAKFSSISSAANQILGKKDQFAVADPSSTWQAAKGTSSDATVTVNARPGAAVGNLEVEVLQTAQAQTTVYKGAALTTLGSRVAASTPPSMSIVVGNQVTTISPASGSAQDMARAINEARVSGVNATAVRVGQDADGNAVYVLQVTGQKTGSDAGFQVVGGDLTQALQDAGATATDFTQTGTGSSAVSSGKYDAAAIAAAMTGGLEAAAGDTVTAAQDAKVKLWNSTEITSHTNTFTDIMDKVDITIGVAAKDAEGKPLPLTGQKVTVGTAPDSSVAAEGVKKLAGSINVVLGEIAAQSRWTESKDAAGAPVKVPGVFSTSGFVRNINNQLSSLAAGGLEIPKQGGGTEYVSMSEFGLKLTSPEKGLVNLEFDQAKFDEAMRKDPARVEAMMTAFASKVGEFADKASNSSTGMITTQITSRQSSQRQIEDQIVNQDARLKMRESALQRQFAAMEKAVQKSQAQGQWLAGQIANLGKN